MSYLSIVVQRGVPSSVTSGVYFLFYNLLSEHMLLYNFKCLCDSSVTNGLLLGNFQ